MKLLQVCDLHYRLRQLDWLASVADTVDAVVIAGDLLDIRSPVPLQVQMIAVTTALRMLGTEVRLLVASGNHDLDSRDEAGEKVARWLSAARTDRVHVDGESFVIDETLFTICPWWDGTVGRAALEQHLVTEAARPRRRWVWVHHAPPERVAAVLGRPALVRRRSTHRLDSPVPTGPRARRACPPGAVRPWRGLGGPDRDHLGRQPGPAARRRPRARPDRPLRGHRDLDLGRGTGAR